MIRIPALAALFAVALALPTQAQDRSGLFPPEIISAGAGGSYTDRLGESPWWGPRAKSLRGMRMFIGGITRSSWSIRLEQAGNGHWTGYLREHDGRRLVRDDRFTVRDSDVQTLQALAAEAELWTVYPEFWVTEEFCLDGEIVVFERLDANGYRYAEGNAQCGLGLAQLAVAAKFMDIADRPDLKRLLE